MKKHDHFNNHNNIRDKPVHGHETVAVEAASCAIVEINHVNRLIVGSHVPHSERSLVAAGARSSCWTSVLQLMLWVQLQTISVSTNYRYTCAYRAAMMLWMKLMMMLLRLRELGALRHRSGKAAEHVVSKVSKSLEAPAAVVLNTRVLKVVALLQLVRAAQGEQIVLAPLGKVLSSEKRKKLVMRIRRCVCEYVSN